MNYGHLLRDEVFETGGTAPVTAHQCEDDERVFGRWFRGLAVREGWWRASFA